MSKNPRKQWENGFLGKGVSTTLSVLKLCICSCHVSFELVSLVETQKLIDSEVPPDASALIIRDEDVPHLIATRWNDLPLQSRGELLRLTLPHIRQHVQ